jgi:hypothetical protein
MKLNLRQVVAALLAPLAVVALFATAQAQTSGLQTPIVLQGAGPFHRLTLPNAIYGHAAFDDLRDVRVHNSSGQAVPFAWLNADQDMGSAAPRTASVNAALFAVPVTAAAAPAASLALVPRADGSLGWANAAAGNTAVSGTGTGTGTGAVIEWIIDASQLDAALVQARFELPPDAQGLFPFALEGSDDLRQWRRMGADDQLVRLRRGDQTVERLVVEIEQVRVRYLRLRWLDAARAPTLVRVWLDGVQGAVPLTAALEWSTEVRASGCGADFCDYPVPRHLPVQSMRIALTEPNTLAALRVFSVGPQRSATGSGGILPARTPLNPLYVLRHGAGHREREGAVAAASETWVADTLVYRLNQASGEVVSANVAMDGGTHTTLRLRTTGPVSALGAAPPVLSFGARPKTLAFLAQGSPPFVLHWNAPGQVMEVGVAGPLPVGTLMPGYREGQAFVADTARVSLQPVSPSVTPMAASVAAAPPAASKLWLWAALGAGLLLLAGMAWSLLRGLSKQSSETSS